MTASAEVVALVEPNVRGRALGRIVSATGHQMIVLIDHGLNVSGLIQMGHLVKVVLPASTVYGIVTGLSIPIPMIDQAGSELKIAEVSLMGEVANPSMPGGGRFRRGVSNLPSLDDIVFVAAEADSALVYAMAGEQTIAIGTVHQDPTVKAQVSINDMLGKHMAVVGTTGTGKSCCLTLILKRALEKNPNAHVLLLDPHGEYAAAFVGQSELLSAGTLELPYWLFDFEEMVQVVLGDNAKDMQAETQCLRELILAAKSRFSGGKDAASRITVDTPVPYTMGDFLRLLDDATGRIDQRADIGPYMRLKSRMTSLQADRRYSFMFPSGLYVSDNLTQILGRIFRVPVDGKPIAILDLSGVPSEVLNVVVSVLCRMAFDFALWGGHEVPMLLVCEEAHRYAPQDSKLGFAPATRALARIAKEGRKYGISLCVVSQRPSELDASLLSQCNTVFALRMTSAKDQEIIQASLSDTIGGLMSSLPLLGNAEAVVVGEGVPVPMRVRFDELPPDQRPRSNSAKFSARWQADEASRSVLDRIVRLWRRQDPGEGPTRTV
jgi:DNA helicase HerA-like ATPase